MKKVAWLLLFASFTLVAQQTENDSVSLQAPKIYRTTETDTRPELVDGMYTLSKYISKKLALPDVHNRKVMIFVGFVIETDSTLSDIKFIHLSASKLYNNSSDPTDENSSFDEDPEYTDLKSQAVEAIAEFRGKWIPATKDGLPVRCQYNYPITINIE